MEIFQLDSSEKLKINLLGEMDMNVHIHQIWNDMIMVVLLLLVERVYNERLCPYNDIPMK